METYDVQFLQEALDDLEEIVLYIAQDSRQAAFLRNEKTFATIYESAII